MQIVDIHGTTHHLKIGSEIFIPNVRGRGGHGAFVLITKFNRKTFEAIERERSYNPGTEWRVHVNSTFSIVGYKNDLRVDYWVND